MASLHLERLNLLIGGDGGVSASMVARRLGISASGLSRYRSGQREPSLRTFREMCLIFGVSSDWLLGIESADFEARRSEFEERALALTPERLRALETGARALARLAFEAGGNPIPDEWAVELDSAAGRPHPAPSPPVPHIVAEAPGEYLETPYASEVRASAGEGSPVFEESADFRVRLRRSALPRWVSTRDLVCIRVSGDSMEPGIRDGDLLAIDHSRIEPTDNRKFAVATDDGLVVKRLRRAGAGWELMSDNPEQAPRNRPMGEEDRIVGQVAWNGPPLPGMVAPRDAID